MSIIFYIVVGLIIIVLSKWYEPIIYGKIGEWVVSRKLHRLDSEHFKILNDLLLPSNGNIKTTQIDHVVVSNYGIFCIETKAYSGWIFGQANDQYWTQVIYSYKKRFYNPLRQNYAHTKALEDLFRPLYPSVGIMSFIAFPNASKLKITGTDAVGRAIDIVNKIKTYQTQILTDADRDKIVAMLIAANILDKFERKLHIKNTKTLRNTKI